MAWRMTRDDEMEKIEGAMGIHLNGLWNRFDGRQLHHFSRGYFAKTRM